MLIWGTADNTAHYTILGAQKGIMETQCWVQEITAVPVRAQETQAVDIQMQTPATCNIPPTRSCATANQDTQVSLIPTVDLLINKTVAELPV